MGFFSSLTKPFKKAWDAVEGAVSNTWDAVVDTTKDVVDLAAPFVGAGSQFAGGVMSSNATSASNAANLALAREQFEWQKAYAQNRLQWQVEDAKKAGLHPMVAAGLSPTSFSPVSANTSPIDYDWVGQAGQSLSYAAAKAKTNRQQQAAFDFQMQLGQEQLNGVRLDNELKMMNILSEVSRLTQTGPAAPEANTNNPINEPESPFNSGSPYLDKPIVRDGWLLDEHGRKIGIVPSEDAAQRFEDKLILEWVPFAGSMARSFKGKFLGQKVNGHWWHGEDKGFLPYPPKSKRGFFDHASDAVNFYRNYDG